MTESTTLPPRLQGEIALIAKAWKDESFKQALLFNPKATIEQELGFTYPEGVTVQSVEAKPDVFYLRLPEKPAEADSTSLEDLAAALAETNGPALGQVIAKTWKDEFFKQAVLDDPKGALSQEFGTPLPDNLSVQVLPESPEHLVVVLPIKPDTAVELSDGELEAVSGGITPLVAAILPFSTAVAATGTVVTSLAASVAVSSAVSVAAGQQTFGGGGSGILQSQPW